MLDGSGHARAEIVWTTWNDNARLMARRSLYSSCPVWLSVSFSTSRSTFPRRLGNTSATCFVITRDSLLKFFGGEESRYLHLPLLRVAIFLLSCFSWVFIIFTNMKFFIILVFKIPLFIFFEVCQGSFVNVLLYKRKVYFFFLLHLPAESVWHYEFHLYKICTNLKF